MKKKKIFAFLVLLILVFIGVLSWQNRNDAGQTTPIRSFNKLRYSTSKPSSLWVIVNKKRALPNGYAPKTLRQPSVNVRINGSQEMLLRDEAATALEKLMGDAKDKGIDLMLVSGYRSFVLQKAVYERNVSEQGREEADKTSARPGYSEHQTGLAADLGETNGQCELQICFGDSKEGKWLAKNAQNYGFIIRYQDGKQSVVGYSYEPWHIRYVGKTLSREIFNNKTTMEEFFNLPSARDYLIQ